MRKISLTSLGSSRKRPGSEDSRKRGHAASRKVADAGEARKVADANGAAGTSASVAANVTAPEPDATMEAAATTDDAPVADSGAAAVSAAADGVATAAPDGAVATGAPAAASTKRNKLARKKKHDPLTMTMVVLIVVGLVLFLYPMASNWWNGRNMDDASANYDQTVKHSSTVDLKAMRKAAREYNKTLLTQADRYHLSSQQMDEYESLLNPSNNGVMGQVVIPKLGLDLPIYHGTSNEVLAVGIGHIPGTSLPVGGPSTHCVISGHRGLPNTELFTNIDQLVEGDTFELHVLGKTLTYQVDQIRIVLPYQVNDLNIIPGEDLCTLVTCTPYQVNTHRLLVRGHRIPNAKSMDVSADATQVDSQIEAVVLFAAIAAFSWAAYLLRDRRRRHAVEDLADVRSDLGLRR